MTSSHWSNYSGEYKSIQQIPQYFAKIACETLFQNFSHEEVHFLDVAAGPGTLSLEVLQYLKTMNDAGSLDKSHRVKITTTDFAPGMVEKSREAILNHQLNCDLNIDFRAEVVDASNPPSVLVNSVTHLGCMFGIMFVPNRTLVFERLRQLLVGRHGRAVYGTWRSVALVELIRNFARYLDLEMSIVNEEIDNSPVYCLRDPSKFSEELTSAGYIDIEIISPEHTFIASADSTTFNMLINNPAIRDSLHTFIAAIDEDRSSALTKWETFIASSDLANDFVTEDRKALKLHYIANIGFARAP